MNRSWFGRRATLRRRPFEDGSRCRPCEFEVQADTAVLQGGQVRHALDDLLFDSVLGVRRRDDRDGRAIRRKLDRIDRSDLIGITYRVARLNMVAKVAAKFVEDYRK